MNTRPIKLTEQERTTIVNALTVAARQYEMDADVSLGEHSALNTAPRRFPPPWDVEEHNRSLFHRPRQQRSGVNLRVFRD
jgi:hypothetical protein